MKGEGRLHGKLGYERLSEISSERQDKYNIFVKCKQSLDNIF